jgi:hypothetical protein
MIEFVNEPVSVEVQPRHDEPPRPLAFVWHGRHYQIESWGRESLEAKETRTLHCYLVQTAGPETWELCQETETAQWLLMRHWARTTQVI